VLRLASHPGSVARRPAGRQPPADAERA